MPLIIIDRYINYQLRTIRNQPLLDAMWKCKQQNDYNLLY